MTDHVSGASASPAGDVVPTLRLCQIISWPTYTGYGFDVVTDNRRLRQSGTGREQSSRRGHFVGKVNSLIFHYFLRCLSYHIESYLTGTCMAEMYAGRVACCFW